MNVNEIINNRNFPNFYRNAEQYIDFFYLSSNEIKDFNFSFVLQKEDNDKFVEYARSNAVKEKDKYLKAFKSFWYNDLMSIVNKYPKNCEKFFQNKCAFPDKWIITPYEVFNGIFLLVNGLVQRVALRQFFEKLVKRRIEEATSLEKEVEEYAHSGKFDIQFAASDIPKAAYKDIYSCVTHSIFSELVEIIQKDKIGEKDNGLLTSITKNIVVKFPKQVSEFKSGKTQVLNFLIGMCMKEAKGKISAAEFKDVLIEELKK